MIHSAMELGQQPQRGLLVQAFHIKHLLQGLAENGQNISLLFFPRKEIYGPNATPHPVKHDGLLLLTYFSLQKHFSMKHVLAWSGMSLEHTDARIPVDSHLKLM